MTTNLKPSVVISGDRNRVLASDYLQARADAWERGAFDDGRRMDPVVTDFRDDNLDEALMMRLAFMAGSDWERSHRGRRYDDELNTAV